MVRAQLRRRRHSWHDNGADVSSILKVIRQRATDHRHAIDDRMPPPVQMARRPSDAAAGTDGTPPPVIH